MPSVEGVGARKAALQMLDAVLRRGQTLEGALSAARDLSPPDRAFALAIAGESLRRLPDLDALIDSATRQRLPDDSKARMVLRLALAQKIGLGTPEHALVATALPLVSGGPRRLVHGVLGTLLRRRCRSGSVCRGALRRVARAEACPCRKRVGGGPSGLRRGALVGARPCSIASGAADPARCSTRARPLRRAGRQDDAAGRRRSPRDLCGRIEKSSRTTAGESGTDAPCR